MHVETMRDNISILLPKIWAPWTPCPCYARAQAKHDLSSPALHGAVDFRGADPQPSTQSAKGYLQRLQGLRHGTCAARRAALQAAPSSHARLASAQPHAWRFHAAGWHMTADSPAAATRAV